MNPCENSLGFFNPKESHPVPVIWLVFALSYSGNVSIVFNIVLGLFTRITHNHLEGNQRKSFILPHYKHSGGETPEKYKIDCWNSKGDLCLREKYYGENKFYLFYFIPVFYIILNNIIGDMIYS
jgi:hypothetical protein